MTSSAIYISLLIAAVVAIICTLTSSNDEEVRKYDPIKIFFVTLGISFAALAFFMSDNKCMPEIDVGEAPF